MNGMRNRQEEIEKRAGRGNGAVTFLLAAAGILALYKRIPLTNRIGDIGNAYFGIACDILLFFYLLSGYAVHAAVEGMTASRCSRGQYRNARRVWRIAVPAAIAAGLAGCVLMYLLSGWLTGSVLQEDIAVVSVRFMIPVLFFSSLTGVMRGRFQGMGTMGPTAVSRLVEEIVGLAAMLALAGALGDYGRKVGALLLDPDYEQAFGAAGGALGLGLGCVAAFLILALISSLTRSGINKKERKDQGKGEENPRRILRIFGISFARAALMGLLLYGSRIVDQILYFSLSSSDADTVVQWGIYVGKYRILTDMPLLLTSFLCSSLIESVSLACAGKNMGRLRERVLLLLRLSLMLSLPMAVCFAVMADFLLPALFTAGDIQTAAGLLRIGSTAVVLQALGIALICILRGMQKEKLLMANAAVSLLIHIAFLVFFLKGKGMGVRGVLYSVIIMYIVFVLLSLAAVLRRIPMRADWGRIIGVPVIGSAVLGLLLFIFSRLLGGKMPDGGLCFLGLAGGLVLYFIFLVALRALTEKDLRKLPGGSWLIAAAKALRLM